MVKGILFTAATVVLLYSGASSAVQSSATVFVQHNSQLEAALNY